MARLNLEDTLDRLLLMVRAGHPVLYVVSHEEQRVLHFLAKLVRRVHAADGHTRKKLVLCTATDGIRQLAVSDQKPAPGGGRLVDSVPSALPQPVVGKAATVGDLPAAVDGTKQLVVANSTPAFGGGGWLVGPGLADAPSQPASKPSPHNPAGKADAVADSLDAVRKAYLDNSPALGDCLAVFFDLHPYLQPQGTLVRPLRNAAAAFREYYQQQRAKPAAGGPAYKTVVVVAPSAAALDAELERDVFVLDFPLPEADELRQTLDALEASGVVALDPDDAEPDKTKDTLAGAGRGLTVDAFKHALYGYAVAGVKLSKEHIDDLLYQKARAINSPALEYTPHVDDQLEGLEVVKRWVRARAEPARLASVREQYRLPAPRGVLLCGVAGGGKSMLARLIAKEFKLALLRLDVGALFGAYVGESEERTRKALQMAEVLAPVVLWLDEVEKAFAGVGGGGDGGVSARVFGAFLTWLAEKTDSVFVVATANDIQAVLNRFPEFGRKGRFDEIFFVGLPSPDDRERIFRRYLGPLFGPGGHLTDRVTAAEVVQLAAAHNFQLGDAAGDALAGLCRLLGQVPQLSSNMTGAEIEQAVNEALYAVYAIRTETAVGPEETEAQAVVRVVGEAQQRALYGAGGVAAGGLAALQGIAAANGWVQV